MLGRKVPVPQPYELRFPDMESIRAFEQANWRHKLRAKERCEALLTTPPERLRERVLKHRPTYVSYPVVEELLRRVRKAVFTDARHAKVMAKLALFIADEMIPGKAHLGTVPMCRETKARCYAYLGNCYRVLCQWEEAERELKKAENLLWLGVGDPHVHAELLRFQGSFFKEQRRFSEAAHVLKEAASIYRLLEEEHAEGLALLNLAQVFRQAREPAKALPVHIRACTLIDEYQDSMIGAAAWNELVRIYIDQGRFDDAYSVLQGVSSVYEQCPPDSSVHLVRSWTEGCVLGGLGRNDEALALLAGVQEGFASRNHPLDSALVQLDMIRLLLMGGRLTEVAEVAKSLWQTLQTEPLKWEAEDAVRQLLEAAAHHHLQEQLIETAAMTLQAQLRIPKPISPQSATVAGAWDTFPEG
jgi:tetratricopeptide (TPR) repeat protein